MIAINKDDILPNDEYKIVRNERRKDLVSYKKKRRISVGPYATFYFESYKTMLCLLYTSDAADE